MGTIFDKTILGASIGTGYDEKVRIKIPTGKDSDDTLPLVIMCHGLGADLDTLFPTGDPPLKHDFQAETESRDWLMMGVTANGPGFEDSAGRSLSTFGSRWAQRNLQAAGDYLVGNPGSIVDDTGTARSTPKVDPTRIYLAGGSMGGGLALAYACRHLDPDHWRPAAVAAFSPALSLVGEWVYADDADMPAADKIVTAMDGYEPTSDATKFGYRQASFIDLDPDDSHSVIDASSLAYGVLGVTPIYFLWSALEGAAPREMWDSTETFLASKSWANAGPGELGAGHGLNDTGGTAHSWNLSDAETVCDWFYTKTLTANPLTALASADLERDPYPFYGVGETPPPASISGSKAWDGGRRRRRYHAIDVEKSSAGSFARINYTANAAWTSVVVQDTSNADAVNVRMPLKTKIPAGVTVGGTATHDWHWDPATETVHVRTADTGSAITIATT